MRVKNIVFLVLFGTLIFSGCSSKREYFEPKNVSWEVNYDGSLPAEIVDVTRGGATLKNGQIITQNGLQDIKIPKDYTFLGDNGIHYLATSKCGELIVVDKNSKIVYKKSFKECIASASIKDNKIALVLSSNRLYLLDYKEDKETF